ncbi:hypothetical protein F5148DRAFT_557059 [Russula earlei]|uniref:Uncharacterized protein n=1 Tax=Russula earlei TaxID=71964 RepID=A0ACC0UG52_9AGAM|nr:hypothetical protein F5148DRAFT_557059 [Russula earlei]
MPCRHCGVQALRVPYLTYARDVTAPTFLLPIAGLVCETFFFGVYSALFVFSTIFILHRRSPNRSRYAMLALSVVMYTVSAAHWALNVAETVGDLRAGRFLMASTREFLVVYLPSINYVLSDAIVLWRAWVLWNRRLPLFIPPLISLVCTFGVSIASATYFIEGFSKNSEHEERLSRYLGWSIWGSTIGTNIWATGLMFIRACTDALCDCYTPRRPSGTTHKKCSPSWLSLVHFIFAYGWGT